MTTQIRLPDSANSGNFAKLRKTFRRWPAAVHFWYLVLVSFINCSLSCIIVMIGEFNVKARTQSTLRLDAFGRRPESILARQLLFSEASARTSILREKMMLVTCTHANFYLHVQLDSFAAPTDRGRLMASFCALFSYLCTIPPVTSLILISVVMSIEILAVWSAMRMRNV